MDNCWYVISTLEENKSGGVKGRCLRNVGNIDGSDMLTLKDYLTRVFDAVPADEQSNAIFELKEFNDFGKEKSFKLLQSVTGCKVAFIPSINENLAKLGIK